MSTTEQKARAIELAKYLEQFGRNYLDHEIADFLRRLLAENEALRAELETERIRLAACGVVALADTSESSAKARDMSPKFRSASCDDVARRVDECIALRAQVEALTEPLARMRKALEDRRINTAVDEPELLRTAANIVAEDGGIIAHLNDKVDALTAKQSTWFALLTNAAAELEDAENCLRDPDAKRSAASGAAYYRREANATWNAHPTPAPLTRPVYLVATGEVHEGQETYTRHDAPVPMADQEVLFTRPAVPEGWKQLRQRIEQEPVEMIHKWKVLEWLQEYAAPQPPGEVAGPVPEPEVHEPKCPALDGGDCACTCSDRHDQAVDRSWARFCAKFGDGPDAPYPGMISAFERYYSQSFADKEWRKESAVWAAAWKAAQIAAAPQPEAQPTLQEIEREIEQTCMNTPPGWRCTRTAGHEGPCAAVPCPEELELVQQGMTRLREAQPTEAAQPINPTAEEWLRTKYGAYRGHPEWRALEVAFNAGMAAQKGGA